MLSDALEVYTDEGVAQAYEEAAKMVAKVQTDILFHSVPLGPGECLPYQVAW